MIIFDCDDVDTVISSNEINDLFHWMKLGNTLGNLYITQVSM
jgi:hypothetical protein